MMPFDNSSPASPCPVSLDARREIIQYPQSGMSARLYVAIELAKGLMQTPAWPLRTPTEQVRDAFELADLFMRHQHTTIELIE